LSSFSADGLDLDLEGFEAHLLRHVEHGVAGVFVACGTGEFSALTPDEFRAIVRTSVDVVRGRVPVIAGSGYGWGLARQFARIAEEEGADGILLMPHYLVEAPQEGLIENVERVAENVALPIIVYQRGLVHYSEPSLRRIQQIPNVIGLKDGNSEFVELQRMTLSAPAEFLFFNGSLTAEIQYRPYASIGIAPYSSSVASCTPEIAKAFFGATVDGNSELMDRLLIDFYSPLVRLRDSVPGYAVSLIKSAARMRGERVGPVRAPLAEPSPSDLVELEGIIRAGLRIVGAEF
jgi:5-dehydro-4-deoxyglucarate dehydratase